MNEEYLIRAAEEFGAEMRAALPGLRNHVDLVVFLEETSVVFRSLLGAIVCCSVREGAEFVELDTLVWMIGQWNHARAETAPYLSPSSSSSSSPPVTTIVADEFSKLLDEVTQKLRANRADEQAKLELFLLTRSLYGFAPVRPVFSKQQISLLECALATYHEYNEMHLLFLGNSWYPAAFDQLPEILHYKLLSIGIHLFQCGVAAQLSTGAALEHFGAAFPLPNDRSGLSEIWDETLADVFVVLQDRLSPDYVQEVFDGILIEHDEALRRITNMRKLIRSGPSPSGVSDLFFSNDIGHILGVLGDWSDLDHLPGNANLDPLNSDDKENADASNLNNETMSKAGDADHGDKFTTTAQDEYFNVLFGEGPFDQSMENESM